MPDLNSLSDAELKSVTIRLERSRCFGNCPNYTVTLHGDGRVEYEGKRDVKVQGRQQGKIDTAAVKALVAEFAKEGYMQMTDYMQGKSCGRFCTDMPSVTTELSVGAATHRVVHYHGCSAAPKALWELESAIDKTSATAQWTGDVSKQGPYGTTCFDLSQGEGGENKLKLL